MQSADSDAQADLSFAGHTSLIVGFVLRSLIWYSRGIQKNIVLFLHENIFTLNKDHLVLSGRNITKNNIIFFTTYHPMSRFSR